MTTAQDTRVGTYEAMFLASQAAAADFSGLVEHINHLFERASADVIAMKKWDERRLAFEIDKQKRGIYILAYFTCPTDQVTQLERDATISEKIMRLMVIKADHLTDEEIAAHDDRQGLSDEANLKAERGDDGSKTASGPARRARALAQARDAQPPRRHPPTDSRNPPEALEPGRARAPRCRADRGPAATISPPPPAAEPSRAAGPRGGCPRAQGS